MRNSIKSIAWLTVAALMLQIFTIFTARAEIIPYADTTFRNASVTVSTTGKATFKASTRVECASLKVASCYLQLKTGETYQSVKSLVCPPALTNATWYSETKDYSGDMTPGHTYRIKATFDADGHTLTKYSGPIDW